MFAYEGRRESAVAIEISELMEVLFLFVYLICGRSFYAVEKKEPGEGRGTIHEARAWRRWSDEGEASCVSDTTERVRRMLSKYLKRTIIQITPRC